MVSNNLHMGNPRACYHCQMRYFSKILGFASDILDTQIRTTLPLVCKKWREVLYLQGEHRLPFSAGDICHRRSHAVWSKTWSIAGRPLKYICLDYTEEDLSLAAVGQWIMLQQVLLVVCRKALLPYGINEASEIPRPADCRVAVSFAIRCSCTSLACVILLMCRALRCDAMQEK